jgi:hypothetical protein
MLPLDFTDSDRRDPGQIHLSIVAAAVHGASTGTKKTGPA